MHRAVCVALVALGLAAAADDRAHAQADRYRWCAYYFGNGLGGASNCYFVTLEQCRATVSGVGGYCQPNPRAGSADPSALRPARRPR